MSKPTVCLTGGIGSVIESGRSWVSMSIAASAIMHQVNSIAPSAA